MSCEYAEIEMHEVCEWSDDDVRETLYYAVGGEWFVKRHRFGRELKEEAMPVSFEHAKAWAERRGLAHLLAPE